MLNLLYFLEERTKPSNIIPLVQNGVKDIIETVVISDCPKMAVICNQIKSHIDSFLQR